MKQNILALYLIKLSKWFSLVMPVIGWFYGEYGLGLHDVFILKSIYSVAAVAPFIGWLNDMYSLQTALLVSAGNIFLPGIFFLILQIKNSPKQGY